MAHGGARNGAGRPKGGTNQNTRKIRVALDKLLDRNSEKMQGWLDQVAQEDPKEALKILSGLVEYALPKLSRVDGTQKHDISDELSDILKDINGTSAGLPEDKG